MRLAPVAAHIALEHAFNLAATFAFATTLARIHLAPLQGFDKLLRHCTTVLSLQNCYRVGEVLQSENWLADDPHLRCANRVVLYHYTVLDTLVD